MEHSPKPSQPDFSSLTGIMEYFYSVPFEQFREDIDWWFKTEIAKKQAGTIFINAYQIPDTFDTFIKEIFDLADKTQNTNVSNELKASSKPHK